MVRMYRSHGVIKKVLTPAGTPGAPAPTPTVLPQFAQATVNGVAVLDALGWLGGGTAHELAHILRQAAADSLGADENPRACRSPPAT